MGRQYTPYYLFVGPIGPASFLTGATGAHPGDYDNLDTTLRTNNSLSYTSPLWGGAQIGALIGLGETPGSLAAGSTVSAAFKYDYRAWNFALGYHAWKNGNTPGIWSPADIVHFRHLADQQRLCLRRFRAIHRRRRPLHGRQAGVRRQCHQCRIPAERPAYCLPDTAIFNSAGLLSTYQLTPALFLAAGYSYTRENAANGISDPANYHQLSLEQTYSLSKRTAFYVLEAYQIAGGRRWA